jgi:hypothetical protein
VAGAAGGGGAAAGRGEEEGRRRTGVRRRGGAAVAVCPSARLVLGRPPSGNWGRAVDGQGLGSRVGFTSL